MLIKIYFFNFINKVKNYLSFILFVSGFLSTLLLVMAIGGGGVLNDLESALLEIEDLERKNIIDNPPETISAIAKRELKLLHNSQGVKNYITETENNNKIISSLLYLFFTLFLISLAAKIFFILYFIFK